MASESSDRPPTFALSEEKAKRRLIAEVAYFSAERRGFSPGYELDDWLQAEQEVESSLEAADESRPLRATVKA